MLPEISMQWRKENTFFICYSYNQMTYFISGNLVGKMQLLSWKLFFVCAVWSRQCWESTGVSEGNWEHLLPYSWLFLGCTWAGVVAHRFVLVSLGIPAGCRGQTGFSQAQCCAEAGKNPSEVGEAGVFSSLAGPEVGWVVPEVVMFWKMGEIGLNFCCGWKDETLRFSNLVPY